MESVYPGNTPPFETANQCSTRVMFNFLDRRLFFAVRFREILKLEKRPMCEGMMLQQPAGEKTAQHEDSDMSACIDGIHVSHADISHLIFLPEMRCEGHQKSYAM